MKRLWFPQAFFWSVALIFAMLVPSISPSAFASEYPAIHALFEKYCIDCHGLDDPDGNLVMEDFASLMKGGESGPAIVPHQSSESLLVKMIEGTLEKDGKKIVMPPGKKKKLTSEEVSLVKKWIDAGGAGPAEGSLPARTLNVPQITPTVPPQPAINALAFSTATKVLAVARYGEVEVIDPTTRQSLQKLSGVRGAVNALAFSPDGHQLFAAGGETGLAGEISQWNWREGSLVRKWEGHRDAIYAMVISPDGRALATGSYDQTIQIWDSAAGRSAHTLVGHNGAIFGLAFRPDGKILASVSADRTLKLWDASTGERRDTLTHSFKELNAVVFSADGRKLFAAGVDNRIRVWAVSESAAETTNPILESRFAHEGAILRLALSHDGTRLLSSSEDRIVKIWTTDTLTEQLALPNQSDWVTGLAFTAGDAQVAAGRLDGSLAFYDARSGQLISTNRPIAVALPAKAKD